MKHLMLLAALLCCGRLRAADRPGVLVYGATPAGIAAALAAADDGEKVLLIEPTARIGGLVTCGLSHTDFRTFEGLTGLFLDFTRRVERHYCDAYGAESPQVKDCFRGTHPEPKVALQVFEQMIAERPRITVVKQAALTKVTFSPRRTGARRIVSAEFRVTAPGSSRAALLTHAAGQFIDATYEGDLMAAAGVAYRVGREGRDEYGESLAPEQADNQLQAYNFRLIATRVATNRVAPVAPPGYRREDFAGVLPVLAGGRIKQVFGYPSGCIYKAQIPTLPNGKYDINDVSGGLIRLSMPGANLDWPGGDAAARKRIFDEHLRWNVGLLYFLQNDAAVPAKFREEAREWGWCKDEFLESAHLPPQLYVREARRMVGRHVFTERDSEHAPGDARAVRHPDAIAFGDYGNNCHGTGREGNRFEGRHTGEFYKSVPPYQIPYGTLVPRDVENLLVPVAASSSHVGFCALRLEPIWTSLGEAAGHAAHLANAGIVSVQEISIRSLQARLHAAGAGTIYVSDVLPGHRDFAAVQWWGTAGGLHGLAPAPVKPGQRGKNILGQYYEAYPFHAAELDLPLNPELKARWLELARSLGLDPDQLDAQPTRGGFIRRAFELAATTR
jgi:hypothetical protein